MAASLALTALLIGLAGGPHCVAMCGAACAGVSRGARAPAAAGGVDGAGGAGGAVVVMAPPARAALTLQAGRLAGYALVGALAAGSMQSLAWITSRTALLAPVWMLMHLAILGWGLTLLVMGRQPAWVDRMGQAVWRHVRPLAGAPGGLFFTGTLWALMPCGLLYSALLVAALSGGPAQGALAMALFAAGSALSLLAAPWLLLRVHGSANRWRQDSGTRLAGLVLAAVAVGALWMDTLRRVSEWCA